MVTDATPTPAAPRLPPQVYRRFENTTVKLPITKFKILFMGTLTTRREKTIKEIHRSGMNVRRIIGYYGPELITMLGRARIVLNIHSQQPGVLEEVCPCLSGFSTLGGG